MLDRVTTVLISDEDLAALRMDGDIGHVVGPRSGCPGCRAKDRQIAARHRILVASYRTLCDPAASNEDRAYVAAALVLAFPEVEKA